MSETKEDDAATTPRIVDLVFRLVEDGLGLVTERLALAEEELRLELGRLRSLAFGIAIAAAAILVGFQLLNAAVVVLLHAAGMPLWAALTLFGAIYLLGGSAFLWWRLERAREQGRLFDVTRRELEKDQEWIASRRD